VAELKIYTARNQPSMQRWREWGDISGCRVGDAKIREVK